MKTINNVTETLCDDLNAQIADGSVLSIAANSFSIYAYQILKSRLDQIKELRFLFIEPTFTRDGGEKEGREFYIPRRNRERGLCNNEFEVRLRNELSQRAVARECAEWIREKVKFRSMTLGGRIMPMLGVDQCWYQGVGDFNAVDLGREPGNKFFLITKCEEQDALISQTASGFFNTIWNDANQWQDVTDDVIESVGAVYKEYPPEFIYQVAINNIFGKALVETSEDELPKDIKGFKDSAIWKTLYEFQRDAAIAIINKLEKYNGCVLADSVGLGKTFTALAVVKYYLERNKTVLVLCPKKLADNWNLYRENYKNNPLIEDRFRYDVLFHTDLSRRRGLTQNGIDLARFNFSNFDLVVLDESHNFRNGGSSAGADDPAHGNRYDRLLNEVVKEGVPTKVLMLSATPVNVRFNDLLNQLRLAYGGDVSIIDERLNLGRSLDDIFRSTQAAFSEWSKREAETRTTDALVKSIGADFFKALDALTIARSRRHVKEYYNMSKIGRFPTRLAPISEETPLALTSGVVSYSEIFDKLSRLTLSVYTPSLYLLPSRIEKYEIRDAKTQSLLGITVSGRETGLKRLMAINLMKRMESSVDSFKKTLDRIVARIEARIDLVEGYERRADSTCARVRDVDVSRGGFDAALDSEFDVEDADDAESYAGDKEIEFDLADLDYVRWRNDMTADLDLLRDLQAAIRPITPDQDAKLGALLRRLEEKIKNPINPGNRKVLVFTAFADTAEYLYEHISKFAARFGLNVAMITGSAEGKTTLPRVPRDLNSVLSYFSPISKDKKALYPDDPREIDVLVATDCISEGQNLQDCDYLVNYDIHWNPVRIIQRFGRIDRIGSPNEKIQLVNFWPDVTLDEYINLRTKVETRIQIVNIAATGDENILARQDQIELEYRKKQLERLKSEVVDLEEMSTGVSITDLGLNQFRFDLFEYNRSEGKRQGVAKEIEEAPLGLCAVVESQPFAPPGVIFVLKNRSQDVNLDERNRIFPYFVGYVLEDGTILRDSRDPIKTLDAMRALCKGKIAPDPALYKPFNRETRDGRNMKKYSRLLDAFIRSIVEKEEESVIDSLFSSAKSNVFESKISGLDNFELVCFLVVTDKKEAAKC